MGLVYWQLHNNFNIIITSSSHKKTYPVTMATGGDPDPPSPPPGWGGRYPKTLDSLDMFYSKQLGKDIKEVKLMKRSEKAEKVEKAEKKLSTSSSRSSTNEPPLPSREEALDELDWFIAAIVLFRDEAAKDTDEETIIEGLKIMLDYARKAKYIYFHDKVIGLRSDFYYHIRRLVTTLETARSNDFSDIPATLVAAHLDIDVLQHLVLQHYDELPELAAQDYKRQQEQLKARAEADTRAPPSLSPIPQEFRLPKPPAFQNYDQEGNDDDDSTDQSTRRTPLCRSVTPQSPKTTHAPLTPIERANLFPLKFDNVPIPTKKVTPKREPIVHYTSLLTPPYTPDDNDTPYYDPVISAPIITPIERIRSNETIEIHRRPQIEHTPQRQPDVSTFHLEPTRQDRHGQHMPLTPPTPPERRSSLEKQEQLMPTTGPQHIAPPLRAPHQRTPHRISAPQVPKSPKTRKAPSPPQP